MRSRALPPVPLCAPPILLCALTLAACGGGSSRAHRASAATHRTSRIAIRKPSPRLVYRPLYHLAAAVEDPASAPLGNGRFVLLGGLTPADTSTADVIVAGLHGELGHATLPNAQHDAQAAALGGQVYLFGGGQYAQYDHILRFDPATNAVNSAGVLPAPASDVAVAGDGSTAYVVGGFDGSAWLDTIVAYAPGAPPRVVARLPVPLRYAAATIAGGYLLIAGGSTPSGVSDSVLRYDPRTGRLATLARLPRGITHAAAGVLGRTMYLVGGRGDSVSAKTDAILAIDPVTGEIRSAGRLPQPLSDAAVVSLGSRLIVAGGSADGGIQAAVGELEPSP